MFRLIIIAVLLADIAWWWRADHLARRTGRPGLRLGVAAFMCLQLGLILWVFMARWLNTELPQPHALVMAAVYLWHLLVLPILLVTLVPWHTGQGLITLVRRFRTPDISADPRLQPQTAEPSPALSRRAFLATAAVAAPPIATGGLSVYSHFNLQAFRIRPITLTLPTLPRELDGLTIAHVSDMHVGTFTNARLLRSIVEATNRLNADLILLPGDLINNSLTDLPAALDAVRTMQPRHATIMCVGNHDLIENGHEFIRRAKEKTTLLVDESATISIRGRQVQILGLGWYRSEDALSRSVASLAKQVRPGAFPILLAHHPHAFDEAARQGIPLTLSGHTHGGQLMASDDAGFGPLLYRYWSGLYQKPELNDASIVVSNGVGHWYPIRVNAPAEVIHLTLRSAHV